jgi:hypothetical protein
MTISASGAVSWPAPALGTYLVTATAKDSKTGLSGSALYTVTIASPSAPVVHTESISGKVGSALSFAVSMTSADSVTYSLTGQPAGMIVSSLGIVNWPKPVAGNYAVTVTIKDSKTGLSGAGIYSVVINTDGPAVIAPAMVGRAGQPLTGTLTISDPNVAWLDVSLASVPMGMGFSFNGLTITATWPNPVPGSYTMKVMVTDSAGLSTQVTVPITVSAN